MAFANKIAIGTYNNYLNRKCKLAGSSRSHYGNDFVDYTYDFNENDGVNTTVILNTETADTTADYLIAWTDTTTTNNVISRWFIIDATRVRGGQYSFTLKRDVVADNYDVVVNSTSFIEKATVTGYDPAVYNKEFGGVNQIKQSVDSLFDDTGCPWIVGYIASDTPDNITVVASPDKADIISPNITQEPWYKYCTRGSVEPTTPAYTYGWSGREDLDKTNVQLEVQPVGASFGHIRLRLGVSDNSGSTVDGVVNTRYKNSKAPTSSAIKTFANMMQSETFGSQTEWPAPVDGTFEKAFRKAAGLIEPEEKDELDRLYTGKKLIYDNNTNKYYQIQKSPDIVSQLSETMTVDWASPADKHYGLYTVLNAVYANIGDNYGYYINPDIYKGLTLNCERRRINYNLVEVPPQGANATLKTTNKSLSDAPYKMFAIPYGNLKFSIVDGSTRTFTSNKDMGLTLAMQLPKLLGESLYDIQLLPYCPVSRYNVVPTYGFTWRGEANVDYTIAEDASQVAHQIIFWCDKSSFTKKLPDKYRISMTGKIPKIVNECDMWRLVSPNYQGIYEFNAAKMRGVSGFTANCTYKPGTPFIQVKPIPSSDYSIYGPNFTDDRGLICGGDFSLPQVNSAFQNYLLNNKTYQLQFDRSVETEEVNRAIDKNVATFNMAMTGIDTLTAAAMQNVGGVTGGVKSLAGQVVNQMATQAKFDEQIAYKKDMFSYNLQNIMAKPQSLGKVASFTIINNYVPTLEYYTCTETEKQAVQDKLAWNGMTIMRTGKIADFLQPDYSYVQAQILRLDDTYAGDAHEAQTLNDELAKGVYIK